MKLRWWKLGASLVLLGSPALSQKIIQPWEVPCNEEAVRPNLELREPQHVFGELKDESGAPFSKSPVVLRKLDANGKFAAYRTVNTSKDGRYDLGTVDAGRYRFLPAPNRGFKQPENVRCGEGQDCEVKLVIQVSPTDQEFVGCPIQ